MKTATRAMVLMLLSAAAMGVATSGCSQLPRESQPVNLGLTPPSSHDSTAEAQAVLEDFFAAWAAKDAAKAEAHMAEFIRGGQWRFDRLDRVDFGPIEPSPEAAATYLSGGGDLSLGAGPDELRAFRATATFYYLSDEEETTPHGQALPWVWYLERAKDGRWYVTNYGG